MKEEIALPPGIKHCPICANELPVSEFGICRARKDGRNLYCKSCIRNKVTQSRRALKEYKSARKKYIAQQVEMSDLIDSEHLPATSSHRNHSASCLQLSVCGTLFVVERKRKRKLLRRRSSARMKSAMRWQISCYGPVRFGLKSRTTPESIS